MRLLALLLASGVLIAQVSSDALRQSPGSDWLTYHGSYTAQRYSPLTQINRNNVGRLAPRWTYHVPDARHLECTPVVYRGLMYVTSSNEVIALDATDGRVIWNWRDDHAARSDANRGIAMLGDSVFVIASDGYLVSLNRITGSLLWEKQFAKVEEGYYATLAPLAVKDRIIVGVSGGDSGMRGFVAALSAATGDLMWRFYTVPAKGEPEASTWGEFDTRWGGGATWMTGTYDPELNLTYWATGNPWPDYFGRGRRGANLYTDSIVALDADTGKLRWYFQFTPHDTHDWDAESIPVLVDLPYKGKLRKLLVHPNRNGFLYALDRETGQFLTAHPYVELLDWAKGINASGQPIEQPDIDPTPAGRKVCPSTRGASNWMSPSWSPSDKLLFVPTLEQCDIYVASEHNPEPMRGLAGGGGGPVPGHPGKFYLRALDPITGQRKWQQPMTGAAVMWAGTVATAGGLVFYGDDQGDLVAVNSTTGENLWHYNMGQDLFASPMTYADKGNQYVTMAAGTDIFTFALFQAAKPFTPPKEIQK